MHILIGLCMGLALLYYWLLGHWFARVLMFLLLGAVFGMVGLAIADRGPSGFFLLPLGVAAAWVVYRFGIPIYYWRPRIIALAASADERDKQLTRETIEQFNRKHGLTL